MQHAICDSDKQLLQKLGKMPLSHIVLAAIAVRHQRKHLTTQRRYWIYPKSEKNGAGTVSSPDMGTEEGRT